RAGGAQMAGRKLDREALLERLRERSAGQVAEISTILQGGLLSAAGFAMIEILRHPTDWPVRVILWLVSMIACFIIYFRLATRAPCFMSSGTAVFIALPLLGVCEILLFAALTLDGQGAWRYWFAAGMLLAATGVVANVLELRRLTPDQYAADTQAALAH